MNLFGKRKPSTSSAAPGGGTSTKDAISRLREAEEQLTKREEHLMRKADQELAEAKRFTLEKNKRAALTALKRKKLYDMQVEKVSASKMTLEQQRMALEQINISKVTFDAIDAGKRELERLNKEMGVDKVEETMDDLQEQIELQNETADALARPMNAFGIGEDEVSVGGCARAAYSGCFRAMTHARRGSRAAVDCTTLGRRMSWRASWRNSSRRRWTSTFSKSTRRQRGRSPRPLLPRRQRSACPPCRQRQPPR